MKRAIFVVQALALLGACRDDSPVTQTEVAQSSGEEQRALDAGASESAPDAALTALDAITAYDAVVPRDPYAIVDDEPPPDAAAHGARPRRGRARTLVSSERCNSVNPSEMGCQTVGAFCAGGASHCASGPPNSFRPCSGSQWQCRCMETENGPAWSCQLQMHAAGPMAPPELA